MAKQLIRQILPGIVVVLLVLALVAEAGRGQRTRKPKKGQGITKAPRRLSTGVPSVSPNGRRPGHRVAQAGRGYPQTAPKPQNGQGIAKGPTPPNVEELSVPYSKHPQDIQRQHFVGHPSWKRAKEGAKRDSPRGSPEPVHDVAHKPGYRNHFHPVDRNGERRGDGVHHYYGGENALWRGISPQPHRTTMWRVKKTTLPP